MKFFFFFIPIKSGTGILNQNRISRRPDLDPDSMNMDPSAAVEISWTRNPHSWLHPHPPLQLTHVSLFLLQKKD